MQIRRVKQNVTEKLQQQQQYGENSGLPNNGSEDSYYEIPDYSNGGDEFEIGPSGSVRLARDSIKKKATPSHPQVMPTLSNEYMPMKH